MKGNISDVLAEALTDLILQDRGMQNNWAGSWFNCTNEACGRLYAKGGNWTVKLNETEEGPCHFCRAKKALALYEAHKLAIPHPSVEKFVEKLTEKPARNKGEI